MCHVGTANFNDCDLIKQRLLTFYDVWREIRECHWRVVYINEGKRIFERMKWEPGYIRWYVEDVYK